MNALVDTHAILWWLAGDKRLSRPAKRVLENPVNRRWVSVASLWEVAIKISVGKYPLAVPYEDFFRGAIDDNGFRHLPIEPRHTAAPTTSDVFPKRPIGMRASNRGPMCGWAITSAVRSVSM